LLYIGPQEQVRAALPDSTTILLLTTLNQMMANFNNGKKAIHIPPRDLTVLRSGKVCVPSKKNSRSTVGET
jgi:hypothetical protein